MENGTEISIQIYSSEVAVQKVKTQCEILRGQIKNHNSHATHLICIFAKPFVVNFDPFLLFIELANFNFIQMVALSHFIFKLSDAALNCAYAVRESH